MYKFKRIFALMISAAVMTCFMTVSAKNAFNDVDVNSGCFNAVTMLSEMNVVQGDGYGNFNPEKFVSRAEFLSMVKGAFSLSGNTDTDFTDVSDTDWFAEAVGICVNLGIIRGVNSTEFCPDDYLTKEQAASVLTKACEYRKNKMLRISEAHKDAADFGDIDKWAYEYTDKALTSNIFELDNGYVYPKNYVSRADAVQYLCKCLLLIDERDTDDFDYETEIEQTVLGNAFLRSDNVAFKVKTGVNLLGYEVRGYYNDIIKKGYIRTHNKEVMLEFNDLDLGYYTLELFANNNSGEKEELYKTFFCIIEDKDFMQYSYETSPFGMNTLFYIPWSGWDPVMAEMIYNTGARNIRDGIPWSGIEKEKGVYTLYQPETMKAFQKYDMSQLFVAFSRCPFYDNNCTPWTKEGVQGFANFANGLVDIHNGYVKFVDMNNEYWAPRFGDAGVGCEADALPKNYLNMIKTTWETVKKNNPQAVLGGVVGDSGTYKEWTEELFSLGAADYMDYMQYHTYTRKPEEDIKNDARFFKELLKKYGKGKDVPIYLDETGGATNYMADGVSARDQANLIIRQHMASFSNGVEKVYVYCFMDKGVNLVDNESCFGLVYNFASPYGPYAPKESYCAYSVMTRKLSGYEYVSSRSKDNVYCHRFSNGENDINVLYSTEDDYVTLACNSPIKVTDIMGCSKIYEPLNGKIYLDLGLDVLYIEGDFELLFEPIPLQLFTRNAVINSETTFEFEPFSELKDLEITGVIGDERFDISNGYRFSSPEEKRNNVYIIDLESGGKKFARIKNDVSFENRYSVDANVRYDGSGRNVKGYIDISVTNYGDEPLNINEVLYQMTDIKGEYKIDDTIDSQSSKTWQFEMPEVNPGKMYDVCLNVVIDSVQSKKYDYTGRYQYNCLFSGEINPNMTADEMKKYLHVTPNSFEYVSVEGGDDLSADLYLSYDSDNIYFLADVTDDVQLNRNTNSNIWNGDCLQIGISTQNQSLKTDKKMYWEIGFALTEAGKSSWTWKNPNDLAAASADESIQGLSYEIKRDENSKKTKYFVKLPLKSLSPLIPTDADNLKMTVVFNEGDESGVRDGWITWGYGLAESKNPMLFNELPFIKE